MQTAWTDPLLERVNEIAVCTAQDDPEAAARRTEELFDAVTRLADFPESVRTVPELGAPRLRTDLRSVSRVLPCRPRYATVEGRRPTPVRATRLPRY
jgi:plasmid stabilization system protein ParE